MSGLAVVLLTTFLASSVEAIAPLTAVVMTGLSLSRRRAGFAHEGIGGATRVDRAADAG